MCIVILSFRTKNRHVVKVCVSIFFLLCVYERDRGLKCLVYTEYMLSSGKSPHSSPVLMYTFTASKEIAMALKKIKIKTKQKTSIL